MRTTSPLAGLFGKSPIKPLQEHMRVVEECVSCVVPLFEALEKDDHERIAELKEKIYELEDQADQIKNEIRSRLPRGLFLAIDRRDLLDLLHSQDSIADATQDIAGLLVMRRMTIPPPLQQGLFPYLRRNHDAVRQCAAVINELDELVELGFRGRAGARVTEMIDELGRIETDADDLELDLTQALFDKEDSFKPLSVVFWYELIKLIGDIADYAEDVGDRLRLLIAR